MTQHSDKNGEVGDGCLLFGFTLIRLKNKLFCDNEKLPQTRQDYPQITPNKIIPKLPQTGQDYPTITPDKAKQGYTRLKRKKHTIEHTHKMPYTHTHACTPTFRAGLKWGSVLSSFETLSTPSVC